MSTTNNSNNGVKMEVSPSPLLGGNKSHTPLGTDVSVSGAEAVGAGHIVNLPTIPTNRSNEAPSIPQYSSGDVFAQGPLLSGSGSITNTSNTSMHLSGGQSMSNQAYPFPSSQPACQSSTASSGSQSVPLLGSEMSTRSDSNNVNNGVAAALRSVNSTGSLNNSDIPTPGEGGLYLSGANAPGGPFQGQILLSSLGQQQGQHLTSNGSVDPLCSGPMLLQGGNQQQQQRPVGQMPANKPSGTAQGTGVPQQNAHAVGVFTGSKAPRAWHNVAHDTVTRQLITDKIVNLLKARKTTAATTDWQVKLPQMAKKLEEALYFGAASYSEYADQNTLKVRLQHLAATMGNTKAAPQPQHMSQSAPQLVPQAVAARSASIPLPANTVLNKPPVAPPGTVARAASANTVPNTAPAAANPATPARQFISMSQINSLIGGQPQPPVQPVPVVPPVPSQSAVEPNRPSADVPQPSQQSQQQSDPQSDENRKQQVLKQQQQRLLLLRHASKCPNDSKCQVTPHCAGMKQLWKHIMTCRDQDCKTSHCVSSRYVLSHYSKCKDAQCPVCGPVREAIRRNQEKSKQIVDMTKQQSAMAAPTKLAPESASSATTAQKKEPKVKGEGAKGKNKKNNAAVATTAGSGKITLRLPANPSAKAAIDAVAHSDVVIRVPPPAPPPAPLAPEDVSLKTVDNISCAIYSFTETQILDHIKHLQEGMRMKASTVKEKMMPIVDHFLEHPNGYIFRHPVDPVALGIPDYFEIVKRPMDLGTIRRRLESGVYRDWEDTAQDIRLTFDNAMLYNAKTDDVHHLARQFRRDFELKFKAVLTKLDQEIELAKLNEQACKLCGETALKYEPPVYYCNGRRCSCQRIRRGSNYYAGGNNAYHWCAPCYSELKDNQPIKMIDMTLHKKDLQKKKHSEEFDEPWVACDRCGSWVHMVCALFNSRRNTSEKMPFICPLCILKERQALTDKTPPIMPEKKTQAADLPMCKLSAFIEKRVKERLEAAYKERMELLGISYDEVEKSPSISIRQVSSVDKMHRTREGMLARYGCKDYPVEFPCRAKCIVLFQNIDGQDVMLFGMYVYEYDHKCPQPNQRRVYISYLDSVHYYRPREYRTIVYHEILIAYLEYVKLRGFHTAHIWACPPLKGDDYILYCHPQDQKTPKDDILRNWYVKMLDICKERGIVLEVQDIFHEYLANPANDATVLPYFEGDYWVGEAENIIKGLGGKKVLGIDGDDDDVDVEVALESKSKSKAKSKKRERTSTRSAGADIPARRDVVMTKLATIIEPMKDAFFVAKLHSDEYAKACWALREQEIIEENGGAEAPMKRMRNNNSALDIAGMSSSKSASNLNSMKAPVIENEQLGKVVAEKSGAATNEIKPAEEEGAAAATADVSGDAAVKMEIVKEEPAAAVPSADAMSVDGGVAESKDDHGDRNVEKPVTVTSSVALTSAEIKKEEKVTVGGEGDLKKLLPNGKYERVEEPEDTEETPVAIPIPPPQELPLRTMSTIGDIEVIDTTDIDDTQEFEHFETRQAFLNLCQGNHYQFDQLRRAKLASLMVLYHLHNPDTPKFVAQCSTCNTHINVGYRFHCESCDIDYCQNCVSYNGMKIHPQHQLRRVAVAGAASQASALTAEQLQERQRNIQIHLAVLQHSALCSNPNCLQKNCSKMKEFLAHVINCKVGVAKGCPSCKRIVNLLKLHARVCRNDACGVPQCPEMRLKLREMNMRQQEMDDRRRQMMNEMYSRPRGDDA